MGERKYRSLDQQFVPMILKEYKNWTLLLHEDQRYLGRAYVWLLREGEMQRFSEISDDEYSELRLIMKEYEKILKDLFNPDFMNYAWLANLFNEHGGHGHLHLIPRYENERKFVDTIFIDGRWGMNYAPSEKFELTQDKLTEIVDLIKTELG